MQNHHYTSYKTVIELAQDRFAFIVDQFTDSQAKQWLTQLSLISETYHGLKPYTAFEEVNNGKASIPENSVILISVSRSCYETVTEALCDPCSVIKMRWNTSDTNCSYHYVPIDAQVPMGSNNLYTVNDSTVFTGFDTGVVRIAYKGLPQDENGDLMVPDTGSWLEAAVHDLAWKVASNMYYMDKFDDRKLNRLEMERNHYVSQAITKDKMLSRPQREVFKDNYIKTIKDLYPEDSGMLELARREYRNWHGAYTQSRGR